MFPTTFSRQWEPSRVCDCFNSTSSRNSRVFVSGKTSHKWTNVFVNGDFEEFESENWGGKHTSSFYDYFPELETKAKFFAHQHCAQKSAAFTAIDLAKFIDEKFCDTTNTKKGMVTELLVLPSYFQHRNFNFRPRLSFHSFLGLMSS
jgi:hypothetical protein